MLTVPMASKTRGSDARATGVRASRTPVPSPWPAPGPAPTGLTAASSRARTSEVIPAHLLPHRTPAELLRLARRGLLEAANTEADGLRYATAHLAALRAAAAVLAALARPAPRRRGRPTSVWALLTIVAPELSEWAMFFATGAVKRAAAEAGIPHTVTTREADDLVREAGRFVVVVENLLGICGQALPAGLDAADDTTNQAR